MAKHFKTEKTFQKKKTEIVIFSSHDAMVTPLFVVHSSGFGAVQFGAVQFGEEPGGERTNGGGWRRL